MKKRKNQFIYATAFLSAMLITPAAFKEVQAAEEDSNVYSDESTSADFESVYVQEQALEESSEQELTAPDAVSVQEDVQSAAAEAQEIVQENEPQQASLEESDDSLEKQETAVLASEIQENELKNPFSDIDVNDDNWYNSIVLQACQAGLMTGYDDGNFYPNETMTRGMAATVLYRLSGDSVSYQKIFSDVKAGAYYSEAITWTYTNNIMTGYSGYGGLFGVDDCVTREQLAKILYQYGLYLGLDLNTNQSLSKFKDADQVSSFAQKGMKWLVHENIMTGSNNGTTLEPARNATRAECAKLFLYAKDVYDSLSSSVTHAAGIKNLANGKTVCYDENGNYLTGVQKVNGSMYFFSTDTGYMVKNTTVNIDNVLYFADANTGELSATNRKIDTSMMNIHNTYSPYPEDANDYDCDYSDAIGDIEYIVIHYTAGSTSVSGSAANTLDWFNSINTASATFCIDDANIMQYTDYEAGYRDWHCGGTPTNNGYGGAYLGIATNRNSIGIEVCSTNSTGDLSTANTTAWSFTEAVIDNTVALVQSLLNRFPNAQVIRHYDVTGKLCPGIIGWNDYKDADDSAWQAFLQRVYSAN